jgi:hypothetical protein
MYPNMQLDRESFIESFITAYMLPLPQQVAAKKEDVQEIKNAFTATK